MSSQIPIERIHLTPLRHEIEALRSSWRSFLFSGILLVLLGTLASGSAMLTTEITMVFYGILMISGGLIQSANAFFARYWSGVFVGLLSGLIYLVIGLFFVKQPDEAAKTLTLLIAALLMVGGLFRIVASVTYRFHHWGYSVLNGATNTLLGLLIYAEWPASGLWVIGLFLGLEMMIGGWCWIMLSLSLRRMLKRSESQK